MIYSCKDCTKRKAYYHSSCADYIREKEEHDKTKAEIDKAKTAEHMIYEYQCIQMNKNRLIREGRRKR